MRSKPFKKKTDYFIETGSYLGDGISLALHSGFEFIYSIELSPKYYAICKQRFRYCSNVEIIHGDSYFELSKLLNKQNRSFTYWLDGHYSAGDTAKGLKESPLIQELNAILSRGINNELIYIDDMRDYRNFDDELNLTNILKLISKYKPHAQISFEPSSADKEDIMVIEY